MKSALITGVTGQDGAYLAKFLVDKGYRVFGGFRRSSTRNFWRLHYVGVKGDIKLLPLDLLDQSSLIHAIRTSEPDEIYNLAAQSFVDVSFNESISTGEVSGLGLTRLLEAVRLVNPKIKVYQASTSEMFGNTKPPQSEATRFEPASPYAAAKLYSHSMARIFRDGYGLFVSCGILFNHESPIRGIEFVTKKISDGVARIKMGYIDELVLGNLDAKRDWGFAGEYVEAMWKILQHNKPDDFVVATGESHSVREFCEEAFSVAGLDYKKYVRVSKEFYRPLDVNYLLGDPSKAERELRWRAKTHFKDLVRMMVESDIAKYKDPMSHSSQFLKHL